jgi:hypothetical protein
MKIIIPVLVAFFMISGCLQATPSVTVEPSTSTKTIDVNTPRPSRTPRPSNTPRPILTATMTSWVRVYPTKKALLIYGAIARTDYNQNFFQWGDFSLDPSLILYEDGQLILTNSLFEKKLSQAETQAIVSKLEKLGFPQMQETYDTNPDSLLTVPADMNYDPRYPYIEITFDKNSPKSITYRKDQEQYLIQPMKEIVSYLNSFSSAGAARYKPDRMLVAAGDIEQIPEGEKIIPWPEDVPSPLHRSFARVFYIEGNEALKLYQAAGENLSGYFSFEGKNYVVYLRPILPHECQNYNYYDVNLPPPAQPAFICDHW